MSDKQNVNKMSDIMSEMRKAHIGYNVRQGKVVSML